MPAPTAPELTSTTLRPAGQDVVQLSASWAMRSSIELSVVAGQDAGAHFDHDRGGQGGDFLAQ